MPYTKIKGFTIGDTSRVKKDFPKRGGGTHFEWYTGEIFVLDPEVIPNTERYDFEANHAKTQLEAAVRDLLVDLDRLGEKHRTQALAEAKFEDVVGNYLRIKEQVGGKGEDLLAQYRALGDFLRDLNAHKSKLPKTWRSSTGQGAMEIIGEIASLETVVRHTINNPPASPVGNENNAEPGDKQPEAIALFPEDVLDARHAQLSADLPGEQRSLFAYLTTVQSRPSSLAIHDGWGEAVRTEVITPAAPEAETTAAIDDQGASSGPVEGAPRSLLSTLENAGWQVDGEWVPLVELIDSCAVDVLVYHPDIYDSFLAAVEARLSSETLG